MVKHIVRALFFLLCVRGSASATLTIYSGCTDCDTTLPGCTAHIHTIADDSDFGSTLRQNRCAQTQAGDNWYMSCEGRGTTTSETKLGLTKLGEGKACANSDSGGTPWMEVNFEDIHKVAAGECVKAGDTYRFQIDNPSNMKFPDCAAYTGSIFCDGVPNGQCLPGIQYLGMAIDITTTALTGSELQSSNKPYIMMLKGYKEVTFSGDNPWQLDVLQQAENTQTSVTNTQAESSSTTSYTSLRDWQRDRSGSLTAKGNYGVKNAEGSLKVSESVKSSFEGNKVRSERMYTQSRYKVKLAESGATFARQFLNFLDYNSRKTTCPTDGSDAIRKCFRDTVAPEFVSQFGTHIIQEVTMGGRVTAVVESESCIDSSERTQSVDAKICAGITTKVKSATICPEASQTETVSETSGSTSDGWDVLVEGGDRTTCQQSKCDFDAYAETVTSSKLEVIDVELEPITTYIKMLAPDNDVIEFRGTGSTSMFSAPSLQGLEEGIAAYLGTNMQSDINALAICGDSQTSTAKFGATFAHILMLFVVALSFWESF